MKTIRLRPGKERSLQRRHPWIFESAIAKGGGDSGETVRVESAEGRFLAWAAFSPASRIRARAWSFDEKQRIDAPFFAAACAAAIRARSRFAIESDGVRLVHGESDGLPGLIVDRYGDGADAVLVAQFTSAGTERWKGVIADALLQATGVQHLYERSDASVRQLEGLQPATGWLRGGRQADGAPVPVERSLREHGWQLTLNIAEGHKTGFYLDQRDSRQRFFETVRRLGSQRVLNCFCYTGGFSVAALAGGAGHVTSIDSSGPALERARAHVALNGFDAARADFLDADVNASLRQFPEGGADLRRHRARSAQVRAHGGACRAGRACLQGHQPPGAAAAGAGRRAVHLLVLGRHQRRPVPQDRRLGRSRCRVDGYILERLAGAPDHPMTLEFPEGEYLKGLAVMRKG